MKSFNTSRRFAAWGCGAVAALIASGAAAQTFTRINSGPLVTDTGQKLTSVWADIDLDGRIDAFVTSALGADNFLYRNLGSGTFESLTSNPVATAGGDSTAAAWGDYDNDGHLDLFVANRGQNHFLFRGLGGTNFVAVNSSAVLPGGAATYHCAWVDYDRDGHLDLFVVNLGSQSFLYRNNGNGTFTKNTTASIANVSGNWIGSAWGDYDNDGDPDVFMAAANGQADALYRNDGSGVFISAGTGDIVSDSGGATSASWADYDNDGDLDLFVANRDGVNFQYRNNGNSTFTKITTGSIVTDVADSNAGAWGDYDNDGWLDLYVANGDSPPNEANFLYRNNRDGTFTKITTGAPATDTEFSASPAWVDHDNDGDLDLFVANATGGNTLYQNDGNSNHWLKVRLVGATSNRAGIGARIKARAFVNGSIVTQMREISGDGGFTSQVMEAHFGLANANIVAELRVEWPSGATTVLTSISPDQRLIVYESAQSLTHVAPTGLENVEGNYYSGTMREPQLRQQTLYAAANFPSSTLHITELRFRRDISEPPFINASATATVKLSTTSRGTGNMSAAFADNSGPDETTVFNGVWNYSTPTVVGSGIIRPFEIILPLTTPFTYNPASGNLLFDIRITGGTGGSWTDGASGGPSQIARVLSLNPNATTGNVGELTGDVIQFVYQAQPVPTITITPPSGTFTNSVQVSIQSGVSNSVIRYTTDGNDPTGASTVYTGPFTLTQTRTVKARLFVNGFPASEIDEATYTRFVPPDIQFIPAGQLFTNQLNVTLVNNVGGGTTIRYTLNGSAPTSTSTAYAGPINLTAAATIRAQVYLGNFFVSDVFTETYARVYAFGNDGVPFAWREQYFGPGFLTNPCAAADADCDDDGYVVAEEYQYSTDPTDGDSAPEIILTVRAVPRLTFTTIAGRSYRIQRTETLNPPDWQTIVESVLATGPELHYVDEEAPNTSYYQVELIRD